MTSGGVECRWVVVYAERSHPCPCTVDTGSESGKTKRVWVACRLGVAAGRTFQVPSASLGMTVGREWPAVGWALPTLSVSLPAIGVWE